jgi:hypothetical protein
MRADFLDVLVSGSSTALTIRTSTDWANNAGTEQGEMMLENKVAVIYGAGGGVGSAVARD